MVPDLQVNLVDRSYSIRFGAQLASAIAADVAQRRASGVRVAILTDTCLARMQSDFLTAAFGDAPRLVLANGEESKSVAQLARVWDFLAAEKLDRGGVLYAVGGGVIGDLAGFAAASWLRGIAFVQVPTTLLAMVDSSVGGKLGSTSPPAKISSVLSTSRAPCSSRPVFSPRCPRVSSPPAWPR
jgi:3-dehydroquinate synthetase